MTIEDAVASVIDDPDCADLWYALGRLLAMAGQPDRARDCFTRAVALDPDSRKSGSRARPLPSELPEWLDAGT